MTSPAKGYNAHYLIKRASSPGATPSGNYYKVRIANTDLGKTQAKQANKLIGQGRDSQEQYKQISEVSGNTIIPVDMREIGFWLTMLLGVSFFSHQVGGFLGVWLGGVLFERTGSYDVIWWATIFFGVASAVINLPIVERPVSRPAVAATTA